MIALLLAAWAADGTVAGALFDADGAPVAGARVEVVGRSGRTGEDGRFALPVPAGGWEVRVDGAGAFAVDVADGLETQVLVTRGPDGLFAHVEAPARAEIAVDAEWFPVDGEVRGPDGPVAGARIFPRGGREAVSDGAGRFRVEVPGPTEAVVVAEGFQAATVPVEPGHPLAVALRPAARELASLTVTAPYVEGSVASVMDERRESAAVAEVLGAEEMSRSGASDAASALSRVTGLTVAGGRYVFVRGLGDRYSASALDGLPLPSPEPERRVVPLDLFPASVLESVVVQKTWSPDLPGAFGGGLVDLRTRRPPEALVASVSLSGSGRTGTTFARGLTSPGGPFDALGANAGFRGLPDSVQDASDGSPLEEGDLFSDRGYTPEELEALGEAMPNRWSPVERALPPGVGLSATLGGGRPLAGGRVGALAEVTWGNDWQKLTYDRTYWLVGADGALEPGHRYRFEEATNEVQLGAFATAGFEAPGQSITATTLLNRSTEDQARVYQGENRDVGGEIRISRLRWVERQLLSQRLAGTHALGGLELAWRAAYSRATRVEPDTAEIRRDLEESTGEWRLSDRPEGNGRFISALADDSVDAGLDLGGPLPIGRGEPGRWKAGALVGWRERGVDTRRFKYMHKGPDSRDAGVLALEPEQIFTPKHIGPNGFQFEEFTRQTDNYGARQRSFAGYALAELPVGRWVRASAGVRVERHLQEVSTFELFNPNQTPIGATLDTLDVLPGMSAVLRPTETVQVRAAVARTVSRPDFRELSPATFNDVTGGRQTYGNPDLRRASIDHADLRFELYPSPSELLSLSVFTKRFHDPIESVVVVSAQQSVTWQNADRASNTGVELEARKDLPANLHLAGNLALIRSRVELGENAGIQTNDARALQGQAPWAVNLQVGWQHPARADRLTVLWNASGARIEEVGALGAPDTRSLPVHAVDLVGQKALGGGWSLSVKGGNLLDARRTTLQGDALVDAIRAGATGSIGLSWSR